jgi:hypothetical protein
MSDLINAAQAKVVPGSLEYRRIALVRREYLDPLFVEADRYLEHEKKLASLRHETSKGPIELDVRLGGNKPTVRTSVTLERTDETFTVVFDCEEPLMDQVKCTHKESGDPMLWEDNDVEVTLNPSGDGLTMFHVVLSSDNVLAVERHQIGSGIPSDWSSLCGVKSSVERTDRGWRARIDIPVKELTGICREFSANFCRSRVLKDNSAEYIHWSPFASGFQDYENFGRIDIGERFK